MKHWNQRRRHVGIPCAANGTPLSMEYVFFFRVFGTKLMWPWSGCRIVVTTRPARDTRGSNLAADSRLLWLIFFRGFTFVWANVRGLGFIPNLSQFFKDSIAIQLPRRRPYLRPGRSGAGRNDHTCGQLYVYMYKVIKKGCVHLIITIQKVTSNVQSAPRQSPDIYWHAELCSRRPCSVYYYIRLYSIYI
jgi:hypothetical protein